MEDKRTIIALGGGGFSEETDNTLIDDYILSTKKKKKPKLCFVPTASGDAEGYIDKFYKSFSHKANLSHLSLFSKNNFDDPHKHILNQDIIYVGGGNTANLINLWNMYGITNTLIKAWYQGVLLCGISAGMNCWFKEFITNSFFGKIRAWYSGLALLPYSCCPHYDQKEFRKNYQNAIKSGLLTNGYAAEECVGLLFKGEKIKMAFSSRSEARAFHLRNEKSKVISEEIDVVRL